MKNRLVHMLEGFLLAIFTDIKCGYGSKTHDWERDYKRSLHELNIRGMRMLTIDFPVVRKHFDRCLDEGLYSPGGGFLTKVCSKRIKVPAFLRVLYLQVFDTNGLLREEPSIEAIANIRQFYDVFAKLKDKCDDRYIREEVAVFVNNEADLRRPVLDWDGDDLYHQYHYNDASLRLHDHIDNDHDGQLDFDLGDTGQESHVTKDEAHALQRVWDIISSSLGDFHSLESDEEDLLPKHGPGRVSNLRKDQSKFTFSDWPSKLDRVFPFDRYGVVNLNYTPILDESSRWPRNREHPSKLIAVPKTATGPRLIGSEPNCHVWIQQLVRFQLEHRVRETVLRDCISFGDQSPNGLLALQGSHDGSVATVDLKSASDRLSCWTVERVLRRNRTLLERLHACRTRTMRNAIDDQFSIIRLKKCFTQGNACTFPVQTIIYSMIAIACNLISEDAHISTKSIKAAARKVRVFGDDIIVPVGTLPLLTRTLAHLQLRVNLAKTFSKGKFRESCGVDAYDGVNVTPARIKQFSINPSHEVIESLKQASNNFFLKGMWRTSAWITKLLPTHLIPIVGPHDSDGLISFCGRSESHLKTRWNPQLHRTEYKAVLLTSNSKKELTQSAHDLHEFLHVRRPSNHWSRVIYPVERKLGIVQKLSSVMKTGWHVSQLS